MTAHRLVLIVVAGAMTTPMVARAAASAGQICEEAAAEGLRSCVAKLGKLQQRCYRDTGSACSSSHPDVLEQLNRVESRVLERCATPSVIEQAGYGAVLSTAGLVARLQHACTSAIASLAARSYGGPHAAARGTASSRDQKCLDAAWRSGLKLIGNGLKQQSTCIRNHKAGKTCDLTKLAEKLATIESRTATSLNRKCPLNLANLVAVGTTEFAKRGAAQARCLVASAHGDTTPLSLDCGPRASIPVPARGVNTKVTLPAATWGTRCGNGSNYSFNLRLAPAGSPVERIVVHMEGGGFCLGGSDCAGTPAGLFEAINNALPSTGMMSSTDANNPFRDWTKVGLPYCTQDLHIGGGMTDVYPEITVHRYGALNVRAAMRYVRDLIWAEMESSDSEGYRADRPIVVFSGSSAGGYGAAYNYHWMLDDLGWINTTAAPDAALAMDNGTAGVIALGSFMIPAVSPGWNLLPYMPPYCKQAECAEIFGNLVVATAPRLLGTPYQQFLHINNQVDTVQVNTTLFPSTAAFVNAARAHYCSLRNLPGNRSYLRGSTTSIHGQVLATHWDNAIVGGTILRDWVGDAMANPAAVVDRVEEGTLVSNIAGVGTFPCDL